jgi:HEAT repeat protein
MDSLAKLGVKGKGASRTLCECLLDPQKEVMVKAAGTLREVNPELHDRVMPMMVDREYHKRIAALQQLGAMGEEGRPAVPVLVYFKVSVLQGGQAGIHPPPYPANPHAGLVVEVLGAVAPKDLTWTKQLSIWFRTDTNPYVRAKAAGLLAQVDEAKVATELLVKKLAIETDLNVRLAIINALGAIGPDAREAEKALSARASADTNEAIRNAASAALKRIKGES